MHLKKKGGRPIKKYLYLNKKLELNKVLIFALHLKHFLYHQPMFNHLIPFFANLSLFHFFLWTFYIGLRHKTILVVYCLLLSNLTPMEFLSNKLLILKCLVFSLLDLIILKYLQVKLIFLIQLIQL